MNEAQLRYQLKTVLENVACLGSRDPKADEYQNRMIDYIMKLLKENPIAREPEVTKEPA